MDKVRDRAAERGCPPSFQHAIKTSSGRWAKWRMGTVSIVSKNLSTILEPMRVCYDSDDFKDAKDKETYNVVENLFTNPDVELQNKVIMVIANESEHFRGWCRGCLGHADACKQAASKGAVFECPRNRKSVIGPALVGTLMSYF